MLRADLNLDAIVPDCDRHCLIPVDFVHDSLPSRPGYLVRTSIKPIGFAVGEEDDNSILLNPILANLPWYSGLKTARQNIFWKQSIEACKQLLDIISPNQKTRLSEKKMAHIEQTGKDARAKGIVRYTSCIFPAANEERAILLAQATMLISVFDEFWRDSEVDANLRNEFITRLLPASYLCNQDSDTSFQRRLNDIRRSILNCNGIDGETGGTEVLSTLVSYVKHTIVKQEFSTVRTYLDYRSIDFSVQFCWASVKFSLGSSVNISSQSLKRYLSLISDHIIITNDIASYNKDRLAFQSEKNSQFLNVVQVIKTLLKVKNDDAAKSDDWTKKDDIAKEIAYIMQLQIEAKIGKELESLRKGENKVELQFAEAALQFAAGCLFCTVVVPRYGHEFEWVDTID